LAALAAPLSAVAVAVAVVAVAVAVAVVVVVVDGRGVHAADARLEYHDRHVALAKVSQCEQQPAVKRHHPLVGRVRVSRQNVTVSAAQGRQFSA
jgi:hypothetical protein